MDAWIEFKVIEDGMAHKYCTEVYSIEAFSQKNEETTKLQINCGGDYPLYLTVAEPYEEVKAKITAALNNRHAGVVIEDHNDKEN